MRRESYNSGHQERGEKRRRSRSNSPQDRRHVSSNSYRDNYRQDYNEKYQNDWNDKRHDRWEDRRERPRYEDFNAEHHPSHQHEPTTTIVIKGLPSHCTEASLSATIAAYGPKFINFLTQRDTGECRGLAFVEFYSVEYAQHFMAVFAGSAGDPQAQQLIIESRAVTIDYAKERKDMIQHDKPTVRTDWICENCQCQNFARRMECFRCMAPRTETCQVTSNIIPNLEADAGGALAGAPSNILFVRGFGSHVIEAQLIELFRQYAVVKNAMLIRDRMTGVSKGQALVEFHTVEHATYVLSQSSSLLVDKVPLKVAYARDGFVKAHLSGGGYPQPILGGQYPGLTMPVIWGPPTTAAPSYVPAVTAASLKSKPLWPPNFETNGASYVFQSQSGYFWEPLSQFYYCPKSKLYYNSVTGNYYTYNNSISSTDEKNPPFEKYSPPLPLESYESVHEPNPSNDTLNVSTQAIEAIAKKPVIISLGGAKKSQAKSTVSSNSSSKKVSSDIAKWGSIQAAAAIEEESVKQDVTNDNSSVQSQAQPNLDSALMIASLTSVNTTSSAVAKDRVNATSSSVTFACYLCRRQFNSAAQLQRHELESALHKENLAKSDAAKAATNGIASIDSVSESGYRDRASERRAIHGTVYDVPQSSRGGRGSDRGRSHPPGITHQTLSSSAPSAEVLISDVSNPGNQLLRKMGWSEGQGLGREGQGREVPVGVEANSTSGAKKTSGIGADGDIPPIVYGDPVAKRESIFQATLARFNQVSNERPNL